MQGLLPRAGRPNMIIICPILIFAQGLVPQKQPGYGAIAVPGLQSGASDFESIYGCFGSLDKEAQPQVDGGIHKTAIGKIQEGL